MDEALGSIKPHYMTSGVTAGSNATNNFNSEQDDDLWCTHCMDDPMLATCAFCGCRVSNMLDASRCHISYTSMRNLYLILHQQKCFGKHDSKNLLLCEHCDQESHIYCLSPPLASIPEEAWFCLHCVKCGFDTGPAPVFDALSFDQTAQESSAFDEETFPGPPLRCVLN